MGSHFMRAVVVAAFVVGCATQLLAQREALQSELLLPKDAVSVVDSAYGRAMVAHVADALLFSADPACRDSRSLAPEDYRAAARKMLVELLPGFRKYIADQVESEGFKVAFAKDFANASMAEWQAMLRDPAMQKRVAIMQPLVSQWIIDWLIEKILQANVIDGGAIKRGFGALETGDPELLKVSDQLYNDVDAALKALDKAEPSPLASRFREIMENWPLAVLRAYKHEAPSTAWVSMRPRDVVPGLPARLESLCLTPRFRKK